MKNLILIPAALLFLMSGQAFSDEDCTSSQMREERVHNAARWVRVCSVYVQNNCPVDLTCNISVTGTKWNRTLQRTDRVGSSGTQYIPSGGENSWNVVASDCVRYEYQCNEPSWRSQ